MKRLACWAVLVPALAVAAPRSTAALLIKDPRATDAAALEQLRASVGPELELTDALDLRKVLEQPDGAASQVADTIVKARASLRRFDLEAARAQLAGAREAVSELAPSREVRAMAVEIALREAEMSLTSKSPDVAAHFGVALAIEPTLSLDRDVYSPPLIAQLQAVRTAADRAPKVTLRIDTVPSGARVFSAGREHCCTPLSLTSSTGWQVVWAQRDGYRPTLLRLEVSSGGPVSIPLAPLKATERLQPIVEAVRASGLEDEEAAARALLAQLHLDALVVADRAAADSPAGPTRVYRVALATAGSAPAQKELPPAEVAEQPSMLKRRWPVFVAAAVGVGLAIAGGLFGAEARSEEQRSNAEEFAADGLAIRARAEQKALLANGLFVGAGVVAVLGTVFFFTF